MDAGREARKPWRARKTMTPSSRQQMKMLNRMKEGAAAVAPSGGSSPDGDPCAKKSGVGQFLSPGSLRDILYGWYETGLGSLLPRPVEVHLDSRRDGRRSDAAEAGGMALERESPDFRFHEKSAAAFVPDTPQRTSENSRGAFGKRKRTSEEAGEGCWRSSRRRRTGLGKIKGFIEEHMVASMRTWDHQLQHLHERLDHTQCLRKHEGIAIKIVKKISSLNRRVNEAIALQKKELSSRVNLPGVSSQNKILNCPMVLPGVKSRELRPSEQEPSGPRKMAPEATKERTDDVIFVHKVNKNPSVAAVSPPAVPQEEPAARTEAATPSTSEELMIVLTDEKSKPNPGNDAKRGAARTSNSAAKSQNPDPPRPELQPSNQAAEDLSHLPPLPKGRLHQEPTAKFRDTLPPLKLDLSVVRVENPKGIALRWNVQRADPRCAPLKSFHLFLFLEGSQLRSWQETNWILAKKLPMACTLTGFPESSRCYLAMRAKDIYGRYGPFSNIQSVLTL